MHHYLHLKNILLAASLFVSNGLLAQVANDECSGATLITTVAFGTSCSSLVTGSTAGATQSLPAPTCTSLENNDDVWYKFVAASQSIIIRWGAITNNANGNAAVAGYALYTSCGGGEFFCNAIGSAGAGYRIIDGLIIGNTYYFRLWSTLTGFNTISYNFCIQNVPAPPVNNDCSGAIAVAVQPSGTICNSGTSGNTAGATQSSPAPSCSPTFANDDVWYSFTAISTGIRLNFSNAKLLAIPNANANLSFAVYQANCPTTTTTFLCNSNAGSSNGSVLMGGLQPGITYFLRIYSYDILNYMSFDFCLVAVDLPPNDECSNAVSLPVSNGFCTSPVPGTLANATTSAGFGPPVCANLSGSEDVWYKLTVPATGNVIVQTSMADQAIKDVVMEAYTGNCPGLTFLFCDDNGNPEPDAGQSAFHSRISLRGRAPGESIFIRVLGKGTINFGPFAICAWDSTAPLPVSAGGACSPANPVTINAANGNRYLWVPLLDGAGSIVAEINGRGNELGTVDASLLVNSGPVRSFNGLFYMDRNISITPGINTLAAVRFYFTNNELTSLQAVDGGVTGRTSLRVAKTATLCPAPLAGIPVYLTQEGSGSYGADHFVQFTTSSFSTFFLQGPGVALPVELTAYAAWCLREKAVLEWRTASETNHRSFTVERSSNGLRFDAIRTIPGTGADSGRLYRFTDSSAPGGKLYYRLKQTDLNGTLKYYAVLQVDCGGGASPAFYPSPDYNGGLLRLPEGYAKARITLLQATGQQLKSIEANSQSSIFIDLQNLPPGLYILEIREPTIAKQSRIKLLKK